MWLHNKVPDQFEEAQIGSHPEREVQVPSVQILVVFKEEYRFPREESPQKDLHLLRGNLFLNIYFNSFKLNQFF